MKVKDQIKFDRAVAGRVYEQRMYPHAKQFKAGDSLELDICFGDEGPDNWTRCEATVEPKHLVMADQFEADFKAGNFYGPRS